jgi:hypothetical protein
MVLSNCLYLRSLRCFSCFSGRSCLSKWLKVYEIPVERNYGSCGIRSRMVFEATNSNYVFNQYDKYIHKAHKKARPSHQEDMRA